MRRITLLLVAGLLLSAPGLAAEAQPRTEEDKILYVVGLTLADRLRPFELTQEELDMIESGMADGVLGRERKVSLATYGPQIDVLVRARMAETVKKQKKIGDAYLAEARSKPGAQTTESGALYFEIEAGLGLSPGPDDSVLMQYTGSLPSGRVFYDTVRNDGEAVTLPLVEFKPCFREGIQKMRTGGKSRFVCPPETAWGNEGSQLVPAGATVIFEVELLDVIPGTPAGS